MTVLIELSTCEANDPAFSLSTDIFSYISLIHWKPQFDHRKFAKPLQDIYWSIFDFDKVKSSVNVLQWFTLASKTVPTNRNGEIMDAIRASCTLIVKLIAKETIHSRNEQFRKESEMIEMIFNLSTDEPSIQVYLWLLLGFSRCCHSKEHQIFPLKHDRIAQCPESTTIFRARGFAMIGFRALHNSGIQSVNHWFWLITCFRTWLMKVVRSLKIMHSPTYRMQEL